MSEFTAGDRVVVVSDQRKGAGKHGAGLNGYRGTVAHTPSPNDPYVAVSMYVDPGGTRNVDPTLLRHDTRPAAGDTVEITFTGKVVSIAPALSVRTEYSVTPLSHFEDVRIIKKGAVHPPEWADRPYASVLDTRGRLWTNAGRGWTTVWGHQHRSYIDLDKAYGPLHCVYEGR